MEDNQNQLTKLAVIRSAKGLSQQELADATDVPIGNIRNWEQRRTDIINAKVGQIIKLSKKLGCAVEDLVDDDE